MNFISWFKNSTTLFMLGALVAFLPTAVGTIGWSVPSFFSTIAPFGYLGMVAGAGMLLYSKR